MYNFALLICLTKSLTFMRRIDLIKFNAELLQKMQSCGIKLNDWQYVNLYNDYEEMLASGTKKTL